MGDVIDRGPDGIRLLQHIMSHDNMDLIIGNHEFMMLNSISESGDPACKEPDAPLWLDANGGNITFEAYKVLPFEEKFSLLKWLKTRYVIKTVKIRDAVYCLTHSYYNLGCENKRYQELSYADVWNVTWSSIWREDFLTHAADIYADYDYTFICGHVPVQSVRMQQMDKNWNKLISFRHNNVINIDGGCAMGYIDEINNGLIFLRLDDMCEYRILFN